MHQWDHVFLLWMVHGLAADDLAWYALMYASLIFTAAAHDLCLRGQFIFASAGKHMCQRTRCWSVPVAQAYHMPVC